MTFVDWFGDGSVLVAELAFACCAAEFEAAAAGRRRTPTAGPGRVAVVVSGTVTIRLAPALADAVDQLRRDDADPVVVAYGACASSGGPYWDSPVVTSADAVVDVDIYVPGCAPTPAALTAALEGLR